MRKLILSNCVRFEQFEKNTLQINMILTCRNTKNEDCVVKTEIAEWKKFAGIRAKCFRKS